MNSLRIPYEFLIDSLWIPVHLCEQWWLGYISPVAAHVQLRNMRPLSQPRSTRVRGKAGGAKLIMLGRTVHRRNSTCSDVGEQLPPLQYFMISTVVPYVE